MSTLLYIYLAACWGAFCCVKNITTYRKVTRNRQIFTFVANFLLFPLSLPKAIHTEWVDYKARRVE